MKSWACTRVRFRTRSSSSGRWCAVALSEAEVLKGQNSRFVTDLDRAHTAAVMAERRLWDSINTIRDGFAVFDHEPEAGDGEPGLSGLVRRPGVAPGIGYDAILHIARRQPA